MCPKDLLNKLHSLASASVGQPLPTPKINPNVVPHPILETVTGTDLPYISALVYPPMPTVTSESIHKDDYCFELNRNVYYVCTDVNGEWIELPPVTQRQIEASRRVVRYFTGDLEAQVSSSPTFPGCEKNYLRAVLARISASTHISPLGAYQLRTESVNMVIDKHIDNEPQAQATVTSLCRNVHYKPMKIDQILDLKNWMHHEPFIYEHGGVTPLIEKDTIEVIKSSEEIVVKNDAKNVDAKKGGKPKEADKSKGANDKKNAGGNAAALALNEKEPQDEIVVNQFQSCSGDAFLNGSVAWKIAHSPQFDVLKNLVLIKSNIWRGAFAMSAGTINDNIYFGWGIKNKLNRCFEFAIPAFQSEYENNVSTEMNDPTPAEEEAQKQKAQFEIVDETQIVEPKPDSKIDLNDKKNKNKSKK